MQDTILSYGPPPLTQLAADAALDTIDFIAAAVRGFDAIDVTDVLRPLWRQHLAENFSNLPFEMRQWYVSTPMMLVTIQAQWPYLNPWQRGTILQQWAMELPYMLWMLDPVLAQAQALELQQSTRARIEDARQQASPGNISSAGAINELNRQAQRAVGLQNFNVNMTASTINLMRAWSNH